jgi:hypothetical protein
MLFSEERFGARHGEVGAKRWKLLDELMSGEVQGEEDELRQG